MQLVSPCDMCRRYASWWGPLAATCGEEGGAATQSSAAAASLAPTRARPQDLHGLGAYVRSMQQEGAEMLGKAYEVLVRRSLRHACTGLLLDGIPLLAACMLPQLHSGWRH
jgi:hypothetical protein